ncbi:hypothetical protein [Pseudonocardia pini]|uniref:hypothetical protein n=1 Tax=Pseudonocardia pini TaxID=2758030 RepID=UPI0015F1073C|nr:hypothetical protein [Pseudonocardia pini]
MPWYEDSSYPSGWRYEPRSTVEDTHVLPVIEPSPPAATAGEQDHSDPWQYAGEPAGAPLDSGRPA